MSLWSRSRLEGLQSMQTVSCSVCSGDWPTSAQWRRTPRSWPSAGRVKTPSYGIARTTSTLS
eukprot:6221181-Prymnesium_polylepis.1